jgi:hypothetical protein
VGPVQPARHPGAGLIEVRHRRGGDLLARDLDEPAQPGRALSQHRGQRAGGDRRAQQIGQQLRGPVHRQVLVHQQITAQRPHPGPIAGRRTSLGRKHRLGRGPARTPAPLGPMLDHGQAQRWQVEHLPRLDPFNLRIGQLGAAPAAPVRHMPDHLVRLGDLGQMGTRRAGLLAWRTTTPSPLTTALPGPRGFLKAIRRRRLGGIRRVLTRPALQLRHTGLQRGDRSGLRGVDRTQLGNDRGLDGDGRLQVPKVRGNRGLRAAKRGEARVPMGHAGRVTPMSFARSSRSTRVGNLNSYAVSQPGSLL